MSESITLPVVHSNGTSARCLAEDYCRAAGAVADAIRAIETIEFNCRDYYPKEGSWQAAREEMTARVLTLRKVQNELEQVAEFASTFIKGGSRE